jgi:hypothetical protein
MSSYSVYSLGFTSISMTEILVFFVCLQGPGCNEATNAYSVSHPYIKQFVKKSEKRAKEAVGPEAIAVMPIPLLIKERRASFRITKHISVQIDARLSDTKYLFSFSF